MLPTKLRRCLKQCWINIRGLNALAFAATPLTVESIVEVPSEVWLTTCESGRSNPSDPITLVTAEKLLLASGWPSYGRIAKNRVTNCPLGM